jgi:hypothetical protein
VLMPGRRLLLRIKLCEQVERRRRSRCVPGWLGRRPERALFGIGRS